MVGPLTNLEALVALIVFVAVVTVLRRRTRRAIVRSVRRQFSKAWRRLVRSARIRREQAAAFLPGQTISRIRTIDGDTIEDLDSGVRYRVANIDCPETDDRARCYRERVKGEQAKGAAEMIFATAKRVEVRPVGRKDQYGRTIAYLRVNDDDFGRLMIDKGFAIAWDGARGDWCGKNGGLATLAKATSTEHSCKTCGAVSRVPAMNVVQLHARRHTDEAVE